MCIQRSRQNFFETSSRSSSGSRATLNRFLTAPKSPTTEMMGSIRATARYLQSSPKLTTIGKQESIQATSLHEEHEGGHEE